MASSVSSSSSLKVNLLPLRLISSRNGTHDDLTRVMSEHIDSNDSMLGFSSRDVQHDLHRMAALRQQLSAEIRNKEGYEEALACLEDIHEYYNCLLQCEAKGLSSSPASSSMLTLEWESALSDDVQALPSLQWERANLIWNLATLEAYQASTQNLENKVGWSKAAHSFQNAANWLQQLQTLLHDNNSQSSLIRFPNDFSPVFLQFWQTLLMAQSQRCVYESLACAPRPKHLLLAKIAAAAVPLYSELASLIQRDQEECSAASASGGGVLSIYSNVTNSWADFGRAWGLFMNCQAERHQAINAMGKKQWGEEIARLEVAFEVANICTECCEQSPLRSVQELEAPVEAMLGGIKERLQLAERENKAVHQKSIPHRQELMEIRGEKLVKTDIPVNRLLKAMKGEALFQTPSNSHRVRVYVDMFHSDMDDMIFEMQTRGEQRTESARKALATVNLPHSLTAYRQEVAGGGLPDDLWQKVDEIQRQQRISRLKQDLWELRDVAEVARMTYQTVGNQLDIDLDTDQKFRRDNAGFEGHDAEEVQKSFRESLANYDRLLVTAQEGDSVLLRRLEILDTNPKYKLLQFHKSQLDRLLPGVAGSGDPNSIIDTSHLSRLLVDLSGLFHDREVLLNTLREDVKNFDIEGTLQMRGKSGSDAEFRAALMYANKSFDGLRFELDNNIEKQSGLIDEILAKNEEFMVARERTANSSSADSCIGMIEDALEEIDQLSKHLKEGKDFYDVVTPKLEKLKTQVGDVSARLTVERLEYADKTNRHRQEEADALIAQRMSGPGNNNQSSESNNQDETGLRSSGHLGTTNEPEEPRVFVDDEKVATLVGMEFDPAKVVAALTKYNNNMDQALNDLL